MFEYDVPDHNYDWLYYEKHNLNGKTFLSLDYLTNITCVDSKKLDGQRIKISIFMNSSKLFLFKKHEAQH